MGAPGRVTVKASPLLDPGREGLLMPPTEPVPGLPAPVAEEEEARDAGRRPVC